MLTKCTRTLYLRQINCLSSLNFCSKTCGFHTNSNVNDNQQRSAEFPLLQPADRNSVFIASDQKTEELAVSDIQIYQDFISESEEQSLFDEVEVYMKRLRYEFDHWDNVSFIGSFHLYRLF